MCLAGRDSKPVGQHIVQLQSDWLSIYLFGPVRCMGEVFDFMEMYRDDTC